MSLKNRSLYKIALLLGSLATVSLTVGCRANSRADHGAAAGGIGGAVLGGIVGKQLGNTGAGAALGGVTGLLAGGAIGQELDDIEARNQAQIEEQLGRQLIAGAVPMEDVVEMSRNGVDDKLIINHINTHGYRGQLNAQDLIMLKQQGVSTEVISAMQNPRPRVVPASAKGRPIVIEEHHYSPPCYRRPYRHRHIHHHPRGASWGISYSNH